jgi:hypothetical protein
VGQRLRMSDAQARVLRFSMSSAGSGDAFCTAVLAAIRKMAQARQEELRALVNWVQTYERAEAAHRSRKSSASGPPRSSAPV